MPSKVFAKVLLQKVAAVVSGRDVEIVRLQFATTVSRRNTTDIHGIVMVALA